MKISLKTKLLIFIASILIIILFGFVVVLLMRTTQNLETTVPKETVRTEELDEKLIPTQDPSYLEKIKREPFWDMLPYWDPSRHFVIVYRDSADYILITVFATNQETILQYQKDARAWLENNGAALNTLIIRYETSNQ